MVDSTKSFDVSNDGISVEKEDGTTGVWIGGGDAAPIHNAEVGSMYLRTNGDWYRQEGPGQNNWVIFSDNYVHPNHTGEVTSIGDGATALTNSAITNKTTVTAANDDFLLISDTSDSGNLKKVTATDFLAGAGDNLGNHIATQALNMSDFGIDNVADVDFDIDTVNPIYQEGRVFWDNSEHTLTVYNDATDVTHQLGQEGLIRVYNNSGALISNGKCVYITGEEEIEQRPTIDLANANSTATSRVIGITTHDIPNNSFGYITRWGFLNQLDTQGLVEGSTLYLSDITSGEFSQQLPSSTSSIQQVGFVVHAGTTATDGRILVDLRGVTDARSNRSTIILSFQSQSAPNISINSSTYTAAAQFIYAGTSSVFSPSKIEVILAGTNNPTTGSVRIQDITNNQTIAEITGVNPGTIETIISLGIVSNLPLSDAIFEVQLRKDSGPGSMLISGCSLS
jgi:hypothetical protein